MHFPYTTAAIICLLMVTASASTDISFSVPGSGSATAAVPGPSEGDITTTVYETSTFYVTSVVSVPTPVASVSESVGAPADSTVATSSLGYAVPTVSANSSAVATVPPTEMTPTQSLYVTGSQTFVPVTLWENSTTRVIYPQNSTAVEIPTGYPANGTTPSTVVVTTSISSSAVTTSKALTSSKHTTMSSPSATVSEVPTNSAGKVAGEAVLSLGLVAGLMALL